MRVIEVRVEGLSSLIHWVDKLPKELGGVFSPWTLAIATSHTDDIWFYAYQMQYTLAVMHLDWDKAKRKCKITIHSPSIYIEQDIVDYWESFDWQMIDLQPPRVPIKKRRILPRIFPSYDTPTRIRWSSPLSCPICYAVYRYPQSSVDSGTIECQNCGKTFEY